MTWQSYSLAELCEIMVGRTPRRNEPRHFTGDHVWVTIADLNDDVVTHSKERLARPWVIASNIAVVEPGTVLLSYKLTLGKLGIAGTQLSTNEAIAALPIKNEAILLPKYLFYFLKTVNFSALSHGAAKGKLLNRESLSNIRIPIPPLPEQRRIVEILDQADALRKMRAEADAIAERILPALFYKMFGDPARNEKGWDEVNGDNIFAQVRYGVGSPPPFSATGIPFLRAANIKPQGVNRNDLVYFDPVHSRSIQRSEVHTGDVVIVRRGVNTGHCAVIPEEFDGAFVGYDLICVPSKETNPHWFAAAWNYPTLWQQIDNLRSRAAQQGLNKDQIESFSMPRPPRNLQDEFAREVQIFAETTKTSEESKERIGQLFRALLHRAFRGELTTGSKENILNGA